MIININVESPLSYTVDDLINGRAKITVGGNPRGFHDADNMKVNIFFSELEEWFYESVFLKPVHSQMVYLNYKEKTVITILVDGARLFNDPKNYFKGIAITGEVVKENTGHSEKGGHYYVQED